MITRVFIWMGVPENGVLGTVTNTKHSYANETVAEFLDREYLHFAGSYLRDTNNTHVPQFHEGHKQYPRPTVT